jgi:putative membrane protein
MRRNHRQTQDLWKGMLAGMAGGLVASWTMNQFQAGVKKISEASQQGQASEQGQNSGQQDEADDATMKTADMISQVVAHQRLTKEQKKKAGPIVHYAFGTLMGAAYGTASEMDSRVGYGAGVPFGTALWIGADELAVPALGLAGSPKDQPVSSHAQYFAAHVVYGVTTEMVRLAVRAAL